MRVNTKYPDRYFYNIWRTFVPTILINQLLLFWVDTITVSGLHLQANYPTISIPLLS